MKQETPIQSGLLLEDAPFKNIYGNGSTEAEAVANFRAQFVQEAFSECCGAPALDEIHNSFAFCSGCKEQAEFNDAEENNN